MKIVTIAVVIVAALISSPVIAGKTASGKAAICQSDGPRAPCTFIPRNGDGSFTIISNDGIYDFDKVGQDTMSVSFNSGAREVDQGLYTRSRSNRACWIQNDPDAGTLSGHWCIW